MNEWVRKIIDYLSIQLHRSCWKQLFRSYTPSTYLGSTSEPSNRKELVKFTIGNPQTKEWTGRDDQIPRVKCPVCESNQTEDESQISPSYALLLEMNEKR